MTFTLGTLFFFGYPLLGAAAPFIAVIAFLVLLVGINLMLLTLAKRLAPRHTWRHWTLLVSLALVLALLEIALFGLMRELLQQFLLGGDDIARLYRQ